MARLLTYLVASIIGLGVATFLLRATGQLEPLDGKGLLFPMFGAAFLIIVLAPAYLSLRHLLSIRAATFQPIRIIAAGFLTGSVGIIGATAIGFALIGTYPTESVTPLLIVTPLILLCLALGISAAVCAVGRRNVRAS